MEGVVPKATEGRDGSSRGCAAGGLEGRGLVPDQVLQKYNEGRALSRTEGGLGAAGRHRAPTEPRCRLKTVPKACRGQADLPNHRAAF